MKPVVLRGDARRLPLPDESVDLLVTSPPYFALRDYRDGDASLAGQIGSEPTPAAYIAALVECTREWARVLKPSGSMFINLGDKYQGSGSGPRTQPMNHQGRSSIEPFGQRRSWTAESPNKSLMLLPERYRIACVDELGLIARAVLVWSKPNGLPESVTDRVRRSHEDWVHLVKQPRYFAAVDEIREPHAPSSVARAHLPRKISAKYRGEVDALADTGAIATDSYLGNPLGKLPGSVWTVATEPLQVPDGIDTDHFAAYPSEWPRRLILGWSPSGICTACGEGRRPVVATRFEPLRPPQANNRRRMSLGDDGLRGEGNFYGGPVKVPGQNIGTITGYACACTPYTDHPGTPREGPRNTKGWAAGTGDRDCPPGGYGGPNAYPKTGPWREYHFDRWTPPPTRPAVCLDPFGGTGTTAHVAAALGRIGVTVDLSGGYSAKLAASAELYDRRRRKVLGLDPPPKPVPQIAGQLGFFDDEEAV